MTLKELLSAAAAALLAIAPSISRTAELNLSDRPLSLTEGVDSNFFITLDNSDSMLNAYLPDEIEPPGGDSIRHTRRAKSSSFNRIYYDPEVAYQPPLKPDGTSFGQVPFRSAPNSPFGDACVPSAPGSFPAGCQTVDLATEYAAQWTNLQTGNDPDPVQGGLRPAYYYIFDVTLVDCDGSSGDDECYRRVDTSQPAFDQDNFANWFSYYRTRLLLTKTAVSRVLAGVDERVRIGYQGINAAGDPGQNRDLIPDYFSPDRRDEFYDWLFRLGTAAGTPLIAATDRVGDFLTTDPPYLEDPGQGESADNALRECRSNFHLLFTDGEGDEPSPYPFQNINVDGTAQSIPSSADALALRPSPNAYDPRPPYSDNTAGRLADVAFHYWITDLRSGGDNQVPTYIRKRHLTASGLLDRNATFWDPINNPADWQHLVNYSIGMGVTGLIEPQLQGFPFDDVDTRDRALVEALIGGSVSWDSGNRIDDLWHMAINSRGKYFSAQDPAELERVLSAVIPPPLPTSIGGGQTVAQNSGSLTTESALYQATFSATTWAGRVRALAICAGSDPDAPASPTNCDPRGALAEVPIWDSIDTLGATLNPADRLIVTADPISGDAVRFQSYGDLSEAQQDLLRTDFGTLSTRLAYLRGDWTASDTDLDADQQALLDARDTLGADRFEFLSGSAADELRNDGPFRDRIELSTDGRAIDNRLGDILSSPPLYVGPPRRFYPDGLEAAAYSAFRDGTAKNRKSVVYVGANDGMLHALDAANGGELFAYIPSPVFPNLYQLTSPAYSHESYVDGPLNEGDAFVSGAWRTLLAGALGRGGQGVFLLDITAPSGVSANNLLRWEFTDADDPDLGFTYGRPEIIKRADSGAWAVVFGNGYNNTRADGHASTSGAAVLYVVNLANKSTGLKLSTGVGASGDPTGAGRPNGIAFVTPVDEDADFDADYVYAGDLFGNLWRFDLADRSATKVFTALDGDGIAQPITTAVRVVRHPTGRGFLVLFGTGKYIESGSVDTGNTDPQTFYGIWDDLTNAVEITRNALLEQEILTGEVESARSGEDANPAFEVRGVTNRAINWAFDPSLSPAEGQHLGWYIDLPEPGERVHQAPLVRGDRVIFVTVTPEDDPCSAGGSSWLMEVEWKDGSSLESVSPFDFLQNGIFELLAIRAPGTTDSQPSEPFFGAGLRVPGAGVYSAPAAMVISLPEERKFIHTSGGELIGVGESTGLNRFRPWREIR
jgi:type IV pilus assembly protein PilY1